MRLAGLRKENARAWAEVDRLRAVLQKIAEQADNNWTKQAAQEALIGRQP